MPSKFLHYLISAASYLSVVESDQLMMSKMREKRYVFYNGYDDDHPGVSAHFMDGVGRFRIMWKNDRIIPGFAHTSGLRKIYSIVAARENLL